jgi:hypothetical protein
MSGAKELAGKVRRRWRTRLQTPLYLLSLFIAVVIISGGYLYYRTQERAARKIVVDQLTSIATLKVEGISRWLKERLADAQVLVSSPFFSEEVGLYFQKPDDRRREKLLSRLSITAKAYYYSEIIILDAEKNIRLSLPPSIGSTLSRLLQYFGYGGEGSPTSFSPTSIANQFPGPFILTLPPLSWLVKSQIP